MSYVRTSGALAALLSAAGAVSAATSVEVIAQLGDVDAVTGGTITSLNAPFTNSLGQVGFTGNLALPAGGTTSFVWYDLGIVWRNSDDPINTVTGAEGTMGISDTGKFIYSPSVNSNDAVYNNSGPLQQDGDMIEPGVFSGFNSRPTMLDDGTAHWVAGLQESDGDSLGRAMMRSAPGGGTPTILLRTGDMIGGSIIASSGIDFDYNFSANGNYIQGIDSDDPTASDFFVYVDSNVSTGIVAREGTATFAGSGENWANFDQVDINNAGNYIFSGDTNAATSADEFIAYNNDIIMRESQTIDGVLLSSGAAVQAASLNNFEQMVSIWSASGSEHLFFTNLLTAEHTRLLSTGDQVDTTGDGIADATVTDFNASGIIGPGLDFSDHGWVYLEVGLTSLIGLGDEFDAVIKIAVPAPGAAGLLALGGLTALRRRR